MQYAEHEFMKLVGRENASSPARKKHNGEHSNQKPQHSEK